VLWSDHPLSIYAKALKTIVDGTVYFDREQDTVLRRRIQAERNRIIQKMLAEKKKGAPTQRPTPTREEIWHCEDLQGGHQRDLIYQGDTQL
jgi:hypothetical protein